MAERVGDWLRQFESLKAARVDYDRKWQLVSDYILPRRDFSVTKRPGQLRPNRVTSSVATTANSRMMAFLLAYWFDPSGPFVLPNVKRGLAAAGRITDLDDAAQDYLGGLAWTVYDHLMLPKAQLLLRAASMLKEFCAFGCGIIWTGRRRGFGPYFNTRPVNACWWSENEEGEIDTLYFKMMLPVYRVIQRWPAAQALWLNAADKPQDELAFTSIILGCRPRPGGRAGAVGEAKPFAYVAISEEKGAILEETGYDSFPYAVFRYDPLPGEAYAEGLGCAVLPDVMVLNHLQQAVENSASQKASPAIGVPARMFGKTLDRRPSAVNAYNPSGLGLTRADQAIIKLDLTGDPTEANGLIKELKADIESGYMTDWLNLREAGDMTAEEVNERRDLRMTACASIVANLAKPTTDMADRAMDIMAAEDMLAPGPASIGGVDVDWEYAGPLQVAQLRKNAQRMLQLINARGLVHEQDPAAAEAVDLEESLRVIGEALSAPPRTLKSRVAVAKARAAIAQQQAQAANAEKMAQAGAGVRDAAAGAASIAGIGQGQAPAPGGGAPFAPASPLSTPLAA